MLDDHKVCLKSEVVICYKNDLTSIRPLITIAIQRSRNNEDDIERSKIAPFSTAILIWCPIKATTLTLDALRRCMKTQSVLNDLNV